jgi:hypothetical protein
MAEAEHDLNQPSDKLFPFSLESTWLAGTTLMFLRTRRGGIPQLGSVIAAPILLQAAGRMN